MLAFIVSINPVYEIPQTSVGPKSVCAAQTQTVLGLLCHRNTVCYSLSGSLVEGGERDQRHPFAQTPPGSPFRGNGKGALSRTHPLWTPPVLSQCLHTSGGDAHAPAKPRFLPCSTLHEVIHQRCWADTCLEIQQGRQPEGMLVIEPHTVPC